MYQTLKHLEATAPTNPDFEPVLKRNVCNFYCTQPAFELTAYLYKDEANMIFDYLREEHSEKNHDFMGEYKEIYARFEKMSLKDMQPCNIPAPDEIILKAATCVERIKDCL